MSSSGLKVRDTRELLASPGRNGTPEGICSPISKSPEGPDLIVSTNHLAGNKEVFFMSPSLVMANANSSPSNKKDDMSVEVATTHIEPISKKRRILDATEASQEEPEHEKTSSSSDDILARACFAVGIGDLEESVVEDIVPNHQEHNGDMARMPANYNCIRSIRPPPSGVPMPPRVRPPNDMRLHHPIHPAFRPGSDGPYGMEVRPVYSPPYTVPRRMPLHPAEIHHYYAVPRYGSRYPYIGPHASGPPPMGRPLVRVALASGPRERHPSGVHASQAYPFDPYHVPGQTVRPGLPPPSPTSPTVRMEAPEVRQARANVPELQQLQARIQEAPYRMPVPHNTVPLVPHDQISPTLRSHQYSRAGPTTVRPKLHVNSQLSLEERRSPHTGLKSGYVAAVPRSVHPPEGSPLPRSPVELTCHNPFQLPDPQERLAAVITPKSSPLAAQESMSLKQANELLERNKTKLSVLSTTEVAQEQNRSTSLCVRTHIEEKSSTENSLQSRRLREPPEPCVELIPINVPSSERDVYRYKPSEKIQCSESNIDSVAKNLALEKMQERDTKLSSEDSRPLTSNNSAILENPRKISQEHNVENDMKTLKAALEAPSIPLLQLPSPLLSKMKDSNFAQNYDSLNPKRSFRKRWLDTGENTESNKSTKEYEEYTEKKDKALEMQDSEAKDANRAIITIDDEEEADNAVSHKFSVIKFSEVNTETCEPGFSQLHYLDSSAHITQKRSASEPPLGMSLPLNRTSALRKRPASVPCADQQMHVACNPPESQSISNSGQVHSNINSSAEDEETYSDDVFIDRLRLVLNDLISVPEATSLQDLTCPIDELLASLVKRRGSTPSSDSNPRQRLRQDFLVLVKLCMPPSLLEAWGWNDSSPEEILNELVKGSGAEINNGSVRLNSPRDRPGSIASFHHASNLLASPTPKCASSPHDSTTYSETYPVVSPSSVTVPSSPHQSYVSSALSVPSPSPSIASPTLSTANEIPTHSGRSTVSPTHTISQSPILPVISTSHFASVLSTHITNTISPSHGTAVSSRKAASPSTSTIPDLSIYPVTDTHTVQASFAHPVSGFSSQPHPELPIDRVPVSHVNPVLLSSSHEVSVSPIQQVTSSHSHSNPVSHSHPNPISHSHPVPVPQNNTVSVSHTPSVTVSHAHTVPMSHNHPLHNSSAHPVRASPIHQVPISPSHLVPVSPTCSVPVSPTCSVPVSPTHLVPVSSTQHVSCSPGYPSIHQGHPVPVMRTHSEPNHSVSSSPIHPVLSPQNAARVPPSHPGFPPSSPVPVPSSHSSSIPHHSIPQSPTHLPISVKHPTQILASHPPPSPSHQVSRHINQSQTPVYPPSAHHLPPSNSNHLQKPGNVIGHESQNKWPPVSRHSLQSFSRQTSVSSTQSEPREDHLEDDVFSPTGREHTYLHPQNPQTAPHTRPLLRVRHNEHSQENCSPSQQIPQNYGHPASNLHSQNIPVRYLHYSQLPQHSQNVPYHGHHPVRHYAGPRPPHNVRSPTHYPRGAYPYPYQYAYYHPNSPHPQHRMPHRPPGMRYHPPGPSHHPYDPHNFDRSTNPHNAVHLVAQPAAPISSNNWNGTEGEKRDQPGNAIKPSA